MVSYSWSGPGSVLGLLGSGVLGPVAVGVQSTRTDLFPRLLSSVDLIGRPESTAVALGKST